MSTVYIVSVYQLVSQSVKLGSCRIEERVCVCVSYSFSLCNPRNSVSYLHGKYVHVHITIGQVLYNCCCQTAVDSFIF